jgi:2-iminoacetate synthase
VTDTPALLPEWLDPTPWLDLVATADDTAVAAAIRAETVTEREFAALISPRADARLEEMAARSQRLTRGHFGRTVALYAPLYLSNYCTGGCSYCGFASDRQQPRHRLDRAAIENEVAALKSRGIEDVLLLTGERAPQADYEFLRECVALIAPHFHSVSVEAFAMTESEYRGLVEAGCIGITLYQETYQPTTYLEVHRWGEKRDYLYRLDAPARALAAGMRVFGVGALLGLADYRFEVLALFRHVQYLRRRFWRSGLSISFPRICHEVGEFAPAEGVGDRTLVRLICAFRIAFPDIPLVLSTREAAAFRDGMVGIGISRMSVDSRTTVGGYDACDTEGCSRDEGQFDISDDRDVPTFCGAMRERGFEPVFKNWDAIFQNTPVRG